MDLFFNKNKKTVKKSSFSGTSGNDDGDQGVPRAKFYSPGNQTVKNGWDLRERETLPVASLGEGGVSFSQKTGAVIYGRYLATACKGLFFLLGSGLQS